MSKRISTKEQEQGDVLTTIVAWWNREIAAVWCPLHCGVLHPHYPYNKESRRHSFQYPPQKALFEKAPCDPEGFTYTVVFPFEHHSVVEGLFFIINKEKARFETTGLDISELCHGTDKHFIDFVDKNDGDEHTSLGARVEDSHEVLESIEPVMKEVVDVRGNTALLLAVKNGDIVAAKYALQGSGCNIDAQNESGQSALILAVMSGKADIVSLLVQRGASKNIYNNEGRTALSYAHGQPRIKAYLTNKAEPRRNEPTLRLRDLDTVSFHRLRTGSDKSSSGIISAVAQVISINVDQGVDQKTIAVLHREEPFPSVFALSGSMSRRKVDSRLANSLLLNEEYYTKRVFEISEAIGHDIEKSKYGPRRSVFDTEEGRESRIRFACHAEKKLMCFVVDHHCFLRSDLQKKELKDLESIAPQSQMLKKAGIKISNFRMCRCCSQFQRKLEAETKIRDMDEKFTFEIIKTPRNKIRVSTPTTPLKRIFSTQNQVEMIGRVSLTLTPETIRSKYPEYTLRTPSPKPAIPDYLSTPLTPSTPSTPDSTSDSTSYVTSPFLDKSPSILKQQRRQHSHGTELEDEDVIFITSKTTRIDRRVRRRLSYSDSEENVEESSEEKREANRLAAEFWGEVIDLTEDDE